MKKFLPCKCPGAFIKSYDGPSRCSKCDTPVAYETEAKAFHQLDYDYDCPVTGAPIRSKTAHNENLKRHGCHILEPGEREDAERNRRKADEALEASLTQTAEQLVAALPESKKQQLVHELSTTENTLSRS